MNYWRIIFYGLAIFPWTFIISLMTFYYRAGQLLGHPPTYNKPDPKELSIYADHAPFINWSGETWLFSLLIWLILVFVYFIVKRKQIEWAPIVVSGICQFFGILLMFSGISEWYLD